MKKIIPFICFLLALFLALSSCSKKKEQGDYDTAADFTKEDGELFQSVPDQRYDDFVFRILNTDVGSSASNMDAETVDGNNLNEAVFRRNINVEERLGITIEEIKDTPKVTFDIAVNACLSGENTYSAICNTASNMATMAVCGYLVTDKYLSGMDLTKPWWNEKAIDSAAVDSCRYFFFGDLQLSYYDAHSMVGINMDMLSDIDGMPDPYALVESGKWTYDTMLSMMTAAEMDIDGNGDRTYEDRYGVALDRSEILSLIVGCNSFISSRDEYGLPVMSCLTDEKFYDVFKNISDTLYEKSDYVYDTEKNEADGMKPAAHFKSGYSLFYISTVGSLANLRQMDYEFAVLPMPKYTADQKDYVSFISGENASAMGVLRTNRNFIRTSNILENLAAESYRKGGLRECYIETVLAFKYVNNEKSKNNLMMILETGILDPADIYNWGTVREKLTDLAGDSDTYSSTMASIKLKSLSDINDTVEEVNKHK